MTLFYLLTLVLCSAAILGLAYAYYLMIVFFMKYEYVVVKLQEKK